MGQPLVTFVVLTRNRREPVARAVASAASQEHARKEIVVVDNGSTDGTAESVRGRFPDVKIVATGENLGSAAGRNRGIAAATGEYFIFLDDDCVLAEKDAAGSVVAQFEADAACGAIAFRIWDPLTEDRTYDVSGPLRRDAAVETVRFCSGGFAARRKALEDTGGFYEPFFMGHVDTDLSLRILAGGWRIILRGDIEVYHPSRERHGPRNLDRDVYYSLRNSIWLAARLLRPWQWATLLAPKILRAFILAYRSWRLRLFVRGIVDGLRGVRRCLAERRPLSRETTRRARRLGLSL